MHKLQLTEVQDFSACSKEELLDIVRELQQENSRLLSNQAHNIDSISNHGMSFRQKYAEKILDSLPDMLTVVTDSGMTVAVVSSEENNHTGIHRDDIFGVDVSTFLPQHVYEHVVKCIAQAIEHGQSESMSHLMIVDGKPHYYENRTVRIDHDYNLCICRDITDVMLARTQLESLNYAVNQIDENIFALHPDGAFIFANRQFLKDHGQKDVIGKLAIGILFSCKNEDEWESLKREISDNKGVLKYIAEFEKKERKISYEVMVHSVRNINNEEEFWFFGRDITLRLEQERQINELNALMDAILTNIPLYLSVKDTEEFRYLYWNKALEQRTGISALKAIGHTDDEIFADKLEVERYRNDDMELIKGHERIEYIEDRTNVEGEKRVLKTIKLPVCREGSQYPLLIGVSLDITDMKKVEEQLIAAKLEAEQSNRLKSAFLANMSHEIRTPLNAIVGFSKLIMMENDRNSQQEFSDIIDRNADLLLQLINDILDLSKIEAGTLSFVDSKMDFGQLCRDMLEVHSLRVQEGVSLIYEGSYNKFMIVNDRNRLAQVFTNLISNSIKFTLSGEIRFGYTVEDGMIEVYVRDTGMGISKEKLASIFERFVKLNNFVQGTGLGLSITKTIIERLGGIITVKSEVGKGTDFRFKIPYIQALKNIDGNDDEPEDDENSLASILEGTMNVLIAEDDDSNYLLLKKYIEKNYTCCRACNGIEAIEMYEKYKPNLILMDIKMPELDGIEATKIIRNFSSDVPIIALTAFAYESDRDNALDAGCDHFLTKPVSFSKLKSVLEKYLGSGKDE